MLLFTRQQFNHKIIPKHIYKNKNNKIKTLVEGSRGKRAYTWESLAISAASESMSPLQFLHMQVTQAILLQHQKQIKVGLYKSRGFI